MDKSFTYNVKHFISHVNVANICCTFLFRKQF